MPCLVFFCFAIFVSDFGDENSPFHLFDTGYVFSTFHFFQYLLNFSCLFIPLFSLIFFLISLLISRIWSFSCFAVFVLFCMRARILSSSFSFVSWSSLAAEPSEATAWRFSTSSSSAAAVGAAAASVATVFAAVAAVPSVASASLLLMLSVPAAAAYAADASVAVLLSASVVAPSFFRCFRTRVCSLTCCTFYFFSFNSVSFTSCSMSRYSCCFSSSLDSFGRSSIGAFGFRDFPFASLR